MVFSWNLVYGTALNVDGRILFWSVSVQCNFNFTLSSKYTLWNIWKIKSQCINEGYTKQNVDIFKVYALHFVLETFSACNIFRWITLLIYSVTKESEALSPRIPFVSPSTHLSNFSSITNIGHFSCVKAVTWLVTSRGVGGEARGKPGYIFL